MGSSAIVDLSIKTSENLSSSDNKAIENRVRYAIVEKENDIVDAEVRATIQPICPLLTASSAQHKENTSVQEIETDATSLLLDHDKVGRYCIYIYVYLY